MAGSNMSPVAPGARVQPPPPSLMADGDGAMLKVALTVAFWVSEQELVPAQSPLHPAKTDPGSGTAVRLTVFPCRNFPSHVVPQSIPGESDVTEPVPAPALFMVIVKYAATLANAALALIRPRTDTFSPKDGFRSTVLRMALLS